MKKVIAISAVAIAMASGAIAGSYGPLTSDRPAARPDDPCARISVINRDGDVAYKTFATPWLCVNWSKAQSDDNDTIRTKLAQKMEPMPEYECKSEKCNK